MDDYKITKQEKIELRRFFEWSEDINNKTCKNCQWSNYNKGDEMITCGHHIQNFTVNSGCDAWTSPKDLDFLKDLEERTIKLKAKMVRMKNDNMSNN